MNARFTLLVNIIYVVKFSMQDSKINVNISQGEFSKICFCIYPI